jgi:hypothetical protein
LQLAATPILPPKWSEVVVMKRGERWDNWNYAKAQKKDGARVYIAVTAGGEITTHEGYLTPDEMRRAKTKAEKAKANAGGMTEGEGDKKPKSPSPPRWAYIFGTICPAKGCRPGTPWCNTEVMDAHLAEISAAVDPGAHTSKACGVLTACDDAISDRKWSSEKLVGQTSK